MFAQKLQSNRSSEGEFKFKKQEDGNAEKNLEENLYD